MFEHIHYYSPEACAGALGALPYKKAMVLLSGRRADGWGLAGVLAEKEQQGWLWIKEIDANPTQETVYRALEQARACGIEGIVAAGGGSAIDLGKAVSALWGMDGVESPADVLSTVQSKRYTQNAAGALPIVAVPTTSGTGSEVTQWATMWDAGSSAKYSVDAPWLLPEQVWMVPAFTLSLPPRLTLATGLDAVSHAAEAFWARKSNPLVQALSLRAIDTMVRWLPKALEAPGDLSAREQLATGALLAGLAFSRTRTTACHSISYPLTSLYGVEHGFAAAMTLAEVAAINSRAVDCSALLALFVPAGGLQAWLDTVSAGIQQLRLSAWGISADAIPAIVDNAFTAGRMDNNPVEMDKEMVSAVLEHLL